MAGRLVTRRGVDVLSRKLRGWNARDVHYVIAKSKQSFGVEMIPGRTFEDIDDLDGLANGALRIDWLAETKLMVHLGQKVSPTDGDKIVAIMPEKDLKIECTVRPVSGERAFKWMDAERVMMRIYAVVTKQEAAS